LGSEPSPSYRGSRSCSRASAPCHDVRAATASTGVTRTDAAPTGTSWLRVSGAACGGGGGPHAAGGAEGSVAACSVADCISATCSAALGACTAALGCAAMLLGCCASGCCGCCCCGCGCGCCGCDGGDGGCGGGSSGGGGGSGGSGSTECCGVRRVGGGGDSTRSAKPPLSHPPAAHSPSWARSKSRCARVGSCEQTAAPTTTTTASQMRTMVAKGRAASK
jgi:hypothetical protein